MSMDFGLDRIMLFRITGSIATIIIVLLLSSILKGQAKRTQKQNNLRKSRYFAMCRGINLAGMSVSMIALILIWGVDIRNLWVSITGIVAMVAVAFLAVWSLIGNILAGVLLYFSAPFRVDDFIEILPENIRGRVLAINTFFTVLHDENGHYVNVPNSMMFQKYIVNYRHGPIVQEDEPATRDTGQK